MFSLYPAACRPSRLRTPLELRHALPSCSALLTGPAPSPLSPLSSPLSNRSILGDASQWGKDCRQLEKYLEMVVDHPVLGRSQHLASFLESAAAPPRPAKLKKGWLSGVKDR
jgi:hypothetical protein